MRFPALTSLVVIATAVLTPAFAKRIQVNGIAAKANGEVITKNEVLIKLAPIQSALMARYPPRGENNDRGPQYSQILKIQHDQILNDLIDNTIIYSMYKDRLNAIPDHVVETSIENFIRRAYAGDRALFKKYLKATNLSYHQFKEQQRKEILVSIVNSQQATDPPPPTEAEMKKEYRRWAIQNRDKKKDVATYEKIYLLTRDAYDSSVTREGQLQLAEDLVNQLKNGASFSELAKKHSRDSMAAEGGLWKDVPRTDLNPDFANLMFDFEVPGKVVGPIEYGPGITIFRITNRKLGPAKPYSQVKDIMKKNVNDEKKNEKIDTWMRKQRAKVPIQKME